MNKYSFNYTYYINILVYIMLLFTKLQYNIITCIKKNRTLCLRSWYTLYYFNYYWDFRHNIHIPWFFSSSKLQNPNNLISLAFINHSHLHIIYVLGARKIVKNECLNRPKIMREALYRMSEMFFFLLFITVYVLIYA